MAAGVTGDKAHRDRLKRMRGPAAAKAITAQLFAGAQDIAIDAAISITTGATSGKNHVPSAPGEPPNADTHVLDRSITGAVVRKLRAEVAADAPYAAVHEMGVRPFLAPATARRRPGVVKRVVDAVNRIVGNG